MEFLGVSQNLNGHIWYKNIFSVAGFHFVGFSQIQKMIQSQLCVEVLRPSQPSGVMSSTVSLPNHTFTGQA